MNNTQSMLQHFSKRAFSTTREEIGNYELSRGTVGRKIFGKGWNHLRARHPVNLQERWHRASVERMFHPSLTEHIATKEVGEKDTKDYRMYFLSGDIAHEEGSDFNYLSPWHDIPFGFKSGIDGNLYFNYINEIPKYDRAKMETSLKEKWNPIKQDIKKKDLRYFKYGDIPFNYGFISQTWENPDLESSFSDVKGLKGDGDPIDVVEISDAPMARGDVVPIKVIAVLGLIDEGETDWKIIGINANDERCASINNINEADSVLGVKYSDIILDWFRNYKVPDGKPQNSFSHGETYQTHETAIEIIEECHRHWLDLVLGAAGQEKSASELSLISVTQKLLMAQGLTSNHEIGQLPRIDYPRYDHWSSSTAQKYGDVDNSMDEFELDEEAPDQRKV